MDVDAQLDELLSDNGSAGVPRGKIRRDNWKCRWGNCGWRLQDQEALIKHVHDG